MVKTAFNNLGKDLFSREQTIYSTPGDMRDDFFRDYCRILHSYAYRRLKHKTQVFFNVGNDHVCTRMEHVNHVESVSHSIALGLNLNSELTRAIAVGHDLGHAPFGHHGETVIDELMKEYLSAQYIRNNYGSENGQLFWHEKNGLRFVDYIELLPDRDGIKRNLNLTYAVRDGIISHCGEIDDNEIHPRFEKIDLKSFTRTGEYAPYTWEGCAVKVSDKIAYLGRDIEDALTLNFISEEGKIELKKLSKEYMGKETLNTTGIMHSLITDICENSTPERGLTLSRNKLELLKEIKKYNYKYIYKSKQFDVYKEYARLVINSLFKTMYSFYDDFHTIQNIKLKYSLLYPKLSRDFVNYLSQYCVNSAVYSFNKEIDLSSLDNEKIYGGLESRDIYIQAVIDYISGMTDAFAIDMFNELISF